MKKVLFGLIATVFMSFSAVAQNATFTKSSMVVLVSETQNTYKKGMTYKDWVNVLVGSTNSTMLTANEDKLLKDIYGFVSSSASPETIYRNYSGQSLLDLQIEKSKGIKGVLNESNAKCGFWCQLLGAVLEAVGEFLEGLGQSMQTQNP